MPIVAAGQPGAMGPAGPQGPVGPMGPPGSDGTATIEGKVDYLMKFTASTIGGNSQVFDNGRNVGIGRGGAGALGAALRGPRGFQILLWKSASLWTGEGPRPESGRDGRITRETPWSSRMSAFSICRASSRGGSYPTSWWVVRGSGVRHHPVLDSCQRINWGRTGGGLRRYSTSF